MGSKSGGGAGPMLEYGDKALDLQKTIYDQSRQDAMPWLQSGGAGLNELTKRLGISTASSPSNRDSLLKQYTPQFTSTMQGAGPVLGQSGDLGGGIGYDKKGDNYELNTPGGAFQVDASGNPVGTSIGSLNPGMLTGLDRFKSFGGSNPTSTTDQAGLNAYVDNMMSQQASSDQSDPNYGSLLQSFDMNKYQADPGYQFRLQQGQQALERKLNASGKTYSPEAAKALIDYNGGSAAQEYGSAYDRYNQDQNNIYNRLAGLSGVGQQASSQLGAQGQNYSNQATDILTGQGNAITAANQGRAVGNQSMFNTLLGAGVGIFSDRRLKWDIEPYGEENGHKTYKFRYQGDNKKYIGVMADEVQHVPGAVVEISGYKAVNYDVLGVNFREDKDGE